MDIAVTIIRVQANRAHDIAGAMLLIFAQRWALIEMKRLLNELGHFMARVERAIGVLKHHLQIPPDGG